MMTLLTWMTLTTLIARVNLTTLTTLDDSVLGQVHQSIGLVI